MPFALMDKQRNPVLLQTSFFAFKGEIIDLEKVPESVLGMIDAYKIVNVAANTGAPMFGQRIIVNHKKKTVTLEQIPLCHDMESVIQHMGDLSVSEDAPIEAVAPSNVASFNRPARKPAKKKAAKRSKPKAK